MAGASPRLEFHAEPGDRRFGTVTLSGLAPRTLEALRRLPPEPRDWERILAVYRARPEALDTPPPPILGRYVLLDDGIAFTPRIPFRTELDYTARFDGAVLDLHTGDAGTASRVRAFRMPEPPARPAPRVTAIYPSGPHVPSNLLRIYVHFSAPMRPRDVHSGVRIETDDGERLTLPFVELPFGLWDPDQRRLTLLIHPGRLKRGVGPHEILGPPLREGQTVRLVIDSSLRDATGEPLAEAVSHVFDIGPVDRASPDPTAWVVDAPDAPDEALVVTCPEPLDQALMERMIVVRDARGALVQGRVEVTDGERCWRFDPTGEWGTDDYFISVDPTLEDLAGNRIDRRFEEPPGTESGTDAAEPLTVARFRVRASE